MNQQSNSNQQNGQSQGSQSSLSADSIFGTLSKFESVLAGLASTVEDARHKIEHVTDLSMKSKEEIMQLRDAFMPYFDRARNASRQVATKVRDNPRPLAFMLVGVLGGLVLWSYMQNRQIGHTPDRQIH